MNSHIKILSIVLRVISLVPVTTRGNNYVALDEHLGEYLPSSLVFITEDSMMVNLVDMIDKTTVISPVYYNCPGLCTPIMDGLVKLLNRTDLQMGKDFQVINISFHEDETPVLAAVKKRNYMELVHDQQAGENWHFMTGDSENIGSQLETLGFSVIMHGEDIQKQVTILGFITMLSFALILIILYPPLKNNR